MKLEIAPGRSYPTEYVKSVCFIDLYCLCCGTYLSAGERTGLNKNSNPVYKVCWPMHEEFNNKYFALTEDGLIQC